MELAGGEPTPAYRRALQKMSREGMEIIDAGPDNPLIDSIARTLNAQWGVELGYGVGDTTAWCRDVAASSTQCVLIAVASERAIGTVFLVENDLPEEPALAPWLSSLWVAPSHRRAGVGTRLIRAVVERATHLDREELFLYCRAGDLSDFYQKRGWRKIGTTQLESGEAWIMRRVLTADCRLGDS